MDGTQFRAVDKYVRELYKLVQTSLVGLAASVDPAVPDDIELVVQLHVGQGDEVVCQYYFVDHNARILFWLHDPKNAADNLFSALQGVYDLSHMSA
jgi:hypothetical protein